MKYLGISLITYIKPVHWKEEMLLQINGETNYDHRWEGAVLLRYQWSPNESILSMPYCIRSYFCF